MGIEETGNKARPFGPKEGIYTDPVSQNVYKLKVPSMLEESYIEIDALRNLAGSPPDTAASLVKQLWYSTDAWALMAIVSRLVIEAPLPVMSEFQGVFTFQKNVFDNLEMGAELVRVLLAILNLRNNFHHPTK